jgi:hypothetical protein
MPYDVHVADLAGLETFPPKAFVAGAGASQDLCDFVVTLALVYNDLRDIHSGHMLLNDVQPPGPVAATKEWGQFLGLRLHVIRVQTGLIDELLGTVRRHADVLHEDTFKKVIRQLAQHVRAHWSAIESVASGKASGNTTAKALALIRNKVVYHYDVGAIGRAYRERFIEENRRREPLLSRGTSMAETRFYFADAAAESYMHPGGTPRVGDRFFEGGGLVASVNLALQGIVTGFVQSRGFAWRPARMRADNRVAG